MRLMHTGLLRQSRTRLSLSADRSTNPSVKKPWKIIEVTPGLANNALAPSDCRARKTSRRKLLAWDTRSSSRRVENHAAYTSVSGKREFIADFWDPPLRGQVARSIHCPLTDAMEHHCPNCQRVLYNRRLKHCGFCGACIPEELRFTPEETAALDCKMAELEASRKRRELAEEAARAAALAEPQMMFPFIIPIVIS
jgi:hypothetical protein